MRCRSCFLLLLSSSVALRSCSSKIPGGVNVDGTTTRRAASNSWAKRDAHSIGEQDLILGKNVIRGVNLGGWLVLEPWITPSLFENKPAWVVDERTYGEYMWTQNDTRREIEGHWSSFITWADLNNIALVGLNTVRIGIGYWSIVPLLTGEPYLSGAYEYLQRAMLWARDLDLHVMIDLHGAPGGQNGFDNSGERNVRTWFSDPINAQRTLQALTILTAEFTSSPYGSTLIAIEVMNEPFPYTDVETRTLKQFYQEAYRAIRQATWSGAKREVVVAIDSAYKGLPFWEGFMEEPGFSNVALDTHVYSIFTPSLIAQTYAENLANICSLQTPLKNSNQHKWTIVGEWTPANTDCAKWLNGRSAGARYDNSLKNATLMAYPASCKDKSGSDPTHWSAEYTDFLTRSFETQTWVYEQAAGWIMWTWKTEQASDWSLSDGLTYGFIPSPIFAKPHGVPCSSTVASSPVPNVKNESRGSYRLAKVSRRWATAGALLVAAGLYGSVV